MEAKLQQRTKRSGIRHAILVHGMGGTGKTQLVLQYIAQHKHEYSMVIWIDAESPASFIYSCIRVSKALQLLDTRYEITGQALVPQRSPPVDDFLSWLENRPGNDNWLLVLDNVDDLTWGIKDILPKGLSGSLIVTSRDSYTARSLGCVSLSLESMTLDEASKFLQIAAFPDLEESSTELDSLCTQIADLLDCLPLAVHLAAATIQTDRSILHLEEIGLNDACLAVKTYIKRFEDSKDELLLRHDHHFMQSPYPRTVLTTFETTFEKLYGDDRPKWEPPPMRLLTLLAFLKDAEATSLHKRFQQAYSGIRLGKAARDAYAAANLPQWLSKILTGESSIDFATLEQSWDRFGYCETLNTLQRYGLIRAHHNGFPEILPLHKIVRWRVQKEGERDIQMYRRDYTVMLELALYSQQSSSMGETLDILNELADYYRDLGHWQYAEECAVAHLQHQIRRHGHCHASTVSSLVSLIEILGELGPDDAKREIFCFVKDAQDRQAVLEVLPMDLLLLLNAVFLRHPERDKATWMDTDRRVQWDRDAIQYPGSASTTSPMPLIGARQALQKSTWRSIPLTTFQPTLESPGLCGRLAAQLDQRRQALKKAAKNQPDLVTLFEVFSMGSSDLLSDYMQYVDSDTVRYRDPVGARTVLHFVAAYGDSKDVQRCVESGSDIHAIDRYGATPLHFAGMVGRLEVFRALVEAKGSTASTDYNGFTPLQYAQRRPDVFPIQMALDGNPFLPEISGQRPMLATKESSCVPSQIFDEMPSNNSRHAYVEDYDSDNSEASPSSRRSRHSYGATHGSARSSTYTASLSDEGPKKHQDIGSHVGVPHGFYLQRVPQHILRNDAAFVNDKPAPSVAESSTGSSGINGPSVPPFIDASGSNRLRDGELVYNRSHVSGNERYREQERIVPTHHNAHTCSEATEIETTYAFQTGPTKETSSEAADSTSGLPDVHVGLSDETSRERPVPASSSFDSPGNEIDTHTYSITEATRQEVTTRFEPSDNEEEHPATDVSCGESPSRDELDGDPDSADTQTLAALALTSTDTKSAASSSKQQPTDSVRSSKKKETKAVETADETSIANVDGNPTESTDKDPKNRAEAKIIIIIIIIIESAESPADLLSRGHFMSMTRQGLARLLLREVRDARREDTGDVEITELRASIQLPKSQKRSATGRVIDRFSALFGGW
ncbi:hypothetical protein M409DRAFT_24815 [Zasmidium cellare ATCC 36951]|uniref:NB-ARC domain-containing protein n=1 Tax=Zasmidium cellare ATCC 36951 TaxID=1080233 RepID=A0A6A6CG51_ZASCE|nr:uncharacterized protein M409DRAFT_24815 [Zasmidium cellare ATCC 36951]KAF2164912.1 hypothetical protein M409DRAFT_24815 [Zasmidium cellare ATCC 36951]